MKRTSIILFLGVCLTVAAKSQDLMDELMSGIEDEPEEVTSVFKGTRIIHGHSVKLRKKRALEMLISHRFGRINSGSYFLWGIDDAQIRIGFDYGVTDNLNIGIGRSSFDKSFDGFIKGSILKQKEGSSPVSMVALLSGYIKTSPQPSLNPGIPLSDRMAYSTGLLMARKFNSKFSMQVMPFWIHKNVVNAPNINDLLALGTGLRYLITPSLSFNLEYYLRINPPENEPLVYENYNSLAIGIDVETGGHVFQLHLSNSRGMMERSFISETTGDLSSGDIHFGFNISRTFQFSNR